MTGRTGPTLTRVGKGLRVSGQGDAGSRLIVACRGARAPEEAEQRRRQRGAASSGGKWEERRRKGEVEGTRTTTPTQSGAVLSGASRATGGASRVEASGGAVWFREESPRSVGGCSRPQPILPVDAPWTTTLLHEAGASSRPDRVAGSGRVVTVTAARSAS